MPWWEISTKAHSFGGTSREALGISLAEQTPIQAMFDDSYLVVD
jgi:hypothetical protein